MSLLTMQASSPAVALEHCLESVLLPRGAAAAGTQEHVPGFLLPLHIFDSFLCRILRY